MTKRAVIIYGPPGAGKGTQAELLERKKGFFHFDTGHYLESVVHDPAKQKEALVIREKKLFDSGKLCTPEWVLKITREEAGRVAGANWNIVFSGSPRTLFEAYGDARNEGLLKTLSKKYGKKNIIIFEIKIPENESIKRNSQRLICSVCGLPVLAKYKKNKSCAFCEGKFYKRSLDNVAVIKVRLKEYANRTYPILARAKKEGYRIKSIDGRPTPYKVFAAIEKFLKLG